MFIKNRKAAFGLSLLTCLLIVLPAALGAKGNGGGQGPMLPPDPLAVPELPGTQALFGANYWYLPYAVVNETQGVAFVKAYANILTSGKQPPKTLKTTVTVDGKKKQVTLHRQQFGVADKVSDDVGRDVSVTDIPLVIAQPLPNANGANVLYKDGHVEFVPFGEFPMKRDFIEALKRLDPPDRMR